MYIHIYTGVHITDTHAQKNQKCVTSLVSLRAFAYRRTCEAFPGSLDHWTTKLVAVCTDGVAVNVGMYNGIVPKLRRLAAVGDSATVRRRERRRFRAPMAPAAPSTSSADPTEPAQFRHPRGQAARSRQASAPAPRRQRASGWGGPSCGRKRPGGEGCVASP